MSTTSGVNESLGLFLTKEASSSPPPQKVALRWESKFAFLTGEQQRDYGAIYRAQLPGQLSVHAPITPTPTRIELKSEGEFLSVLLNGTEAGKIRSLIRILKRLADGTIHWANGIYGPCRLNIESHTFNSE